MLLERVCFLEVRQEDRSHCRGLRVTQYCQLILRKRQGRDSNKKKKEGIREKERERKTSVRNVLYEFYDEANISVFVLI